MSRIPPLGPEVPVWKGRWLLRALGWVVVWLCRWRVTGEFPNVAKAVVIAAPHSSLFDGIIGISAATAINIKPTWMGKDALFKGVFGWFLRLFGGVPTDRSNPRGVVGQMVARFADSEKLWVVLAPEGTRRQVKHWRSGFYHIAVGAGVPIFPVYFHYPEKRIGLLPLFYPTGDMQADLNALQQMYEPWRGRHGKPVAPAAADAAAKPAPEADAGSADRA